MNETLTVELDRQKIEQESRIYGKADTDNLTKYQKSINDAAFKLCLENANLIQNKGKLLDLARKKLDDDGYNYVKRRSRSKTFGSEKGIVEDKVEKRQKLTEEMRQRKVSEISEDIETVNKIMSCLENERVKLVNMQKYSQAGQVLQQIAEKRKEKRKLSDQLAIIQAKEARSKHYHSNKASSNTNTKSEATLKNVNQGSLKSFFRKASNSVDPKSRNSKPSDERVKGPDACQSSAITCTTTGSSVTTSQHMAPHSESSSTVFSKTAVSSTEASSCKSHDIQPSSSGSFLAQKAPHHLDVGQ